MSKNNIVVYRWCLKGMLIFYTLFQGYVMYLNSWFSCRCILWIMSDFKLMLEFCCTGSTWWPVVPEEDIVTCVLIGVSLKCYMHCWNSVFILIISQYLSLIVLLIAINFYHFFIIGFTLIIFNYHVDCFYSSTFLIILWYS